ncbi:chromatin complexes subunit BAP18 [Chironomus tepperi]|uniref:chromatin complexes subunit BAP18 n=1 Tax=Chironomus tepperi TaxID=113505 RepID=UPI00391F68BC
MNVKVSEIFTSAGKAFNTLGDLILQVQTDKEGSSKWSQEEVDMLKNSVTKFNEDLNQLSSHIKAKQTSQIRQTLKNKSYQQAGLVPKVEPVVKPTITQTPVVIQEQVIFHHQQPATIKIEHQLPENLVQQTSSHMTLNRLNAAEEEEMDVESEFQNEVKIETSFSEVS